MQQLASSVQGFDWLQSVSVSVAGKPSSLDGANARRAEHGHMARPLDCNQNRVWDEQAGQVAGPMKPVSVVVSVVMFFARCS